MVISSGERAITGPPRGVLGSAVATGEYCWRLLTTARSMRSETLGEMLVWNALRLRGGWMCCLGGYAPGMGRACWGGVAWVALRGGGLGWLVKHFARSKRVLVSVWIMLERDGLKQ